VTRYEYDNLDRLTSEVWIASGAPTPTVTGATSTQGGATNEVQRVGFDSGAFSLTGGTFTLTYDGQTTGNIAYNATAATVKTALEALSVSTPTRWPSPITDTTFKQEWRLNFQNDLAGTNVAQTTINASNVQAGMMPPMTEIEATDTQGGTNSELNVTLAIRPPAHSADLRREQTAASPATQLGPSIRPWKPWRHRHRDGKRFCWRLTITFTNRQHERAADHW
jgi:hypothetical protein